MNLPTSPPDPSLDGTVLVPGAPSTPAPISERKQARRENWRLIRRRPAFIIGVAIVVFWVVCALFGSRFAPHNPLDFRVKPHLSPSGKYWFGTDKSGRDVFSRVIAGARDVLKIAPDRKSTRLNSSHT